MSRGPAVLSQSLLRFTMDRPKSFQMEKWSKEFINLGIKALKKSKKKTFWARSQKTKQLSFNQIFEELSLGVQVT